MRFLVTGGAGFIGSHLVDALISRGDDVVVLDRLDSQVHEGGSPTYMNSRALYVRGDVKDQRILATMITDIDVIFHLAASVGVGQSMYEITRYVEDNISGTAALLQTLVEREHRIAKLVVASSMSLYGEGQYTCETCGPVAPGLRPDVRLKARIWGVECPNCGRFVDPAPTPETKLPQPNSVYAVTKRDQEELCLSVGRAYGIPVTALRFFNVYGPRQSLGNPYTGVSAIFASRIRNGNPPVVFEDGLQTRDFVSVRDVVRACVLTSDRHSADFHAINIGSGQPTSILQSAKTLIALHRASLTPKVLQRFRSGDVRHCFADLSKARALLDYSPTVDFETGMRELVDWTKTVIALDRFDDAYDSLRSRGLAE